MWSVLFKVRKENFTSPNLRTFWAFTENVTKNAIESDVIIGVIDSEIWPEFGNFDDKGFGPLHAK